MSTHSFQSVASFNFLTNFEYFRLERELKKRAKAQSQHPDTSLQLIDDSIYSSYFSSPSQKTSKKELSDADLLNSFTFDIPTSFTNSLSSSPMVVTDVSTDVSHLEDGKRRKVMQGFSLADVSTLPQLQTKSETISSPEFDTNIKEARPMSLIYNPNYGYDTDVSVSPVRPVNGFSKDDDFSLTPKKKKKVRNWRRRKLLRVGNALLSSFTRSLWKVEYSIVNVSMISIKTVYMILTR